MKMVKILRRELSWSDLWVSSHDKLSDFYAGAWQPGDSPLPLLAIRLALLVAALAIFAWSLVEAGPTPAYLIFLTNWGLMLLTAMLLNGTYVSVVSLKNKLTDGDPLPLCMRSYWFLFNIAITISFVISALYWILLFNEETANWEDRLFWLDIATHGLNSCIALFELLVTRTPVRFLHFYQPLGVGLWYAAFTYFYYVAGGKDGLGNPYIYPVLDWREALRSVIVVAFSAVGLVVIYIGVFATAFFRDKISSSFRTITLHMQQTTTSSHEHMPAGMV